VRPGVQMDRDGIVLSPASMVGAMTDTTRHWTLRERDVARSRRPTAGVFTNLRQARRHLAPALRAAVDVPRWPEEDREMLAEGIALLRGQLDLLERVSRKSN